jgi:hypothetical protein
MATIRAIDMKLIDDLFDMGGGYVLDFTDRTFSAFFKDDLRINIDDPRFIANGTSKAKRLRCFLQTVQDQTAVRALIGLWDYRNAIRRRAGLEETVHDAEGEFSQLIKRLGGTRPVTSVSRKPADVKSVAPDKLKALAADFLVVSTRPPQERGYLFERWLEALFDVYGLDSRAAFRLEGEQIDGSFQLSGETYLVEARWRNAKADVSDLHAFHGKLEEKAFWSRGLFISIAGFSQHGITAFGKGKRLICMDGLDLHETLDFGLALDTVLVRKVRRAAETGSPFASVRELFC